MATIPTTSTKMLCTQSSKAKVIGLANAGGDTINSIKQAAEFGIVKGGQSLAGLLVFASDVAALGLPTAQGLVLTETWYWDMTDANRAWTKRWQQERQGKWPTMIHAGVYSGITHYLKAAVALKGNVSDGKAVVAQMKSMPTDDPLFGQGTIRADGQVVQIAGILFQLIEGCPRGNVPGCQDATAGDAQDQGLSVRCEARLGNLIMTLGGSEDVRMAVKVP